MLHIVSDTDFLPFTKLQTIGNVKKKSLPPADDAASTDIDISTGLAFGNTSQKIVYVSVFTVYCYFLSDNACRSQPMDTFHLVKDRHHWKIQLSSTTQISWSI